MVLQLLLGQLCEECDITTAARKFSLAFHLMPTYVRGLAKPLRLRRGQCFNIRRLYAQASVAMKWLHYIVSAMNEWVWGIGGIIMTGENYKVLGDKTCPSATLSTTNPTRIRPGLNLGLRGDRRDEMAFSDPNSTANKARFIDSPPLTSNQSFSMLRISILSQLQQHRSDWPVTCAMHARLRAEDYRPMNHPLIRFLYTSFGTSRFVTLDHGHLGSWGRHICYTPGRGTSWTGCRYHLAWNVGTFTCSAVSWTSSTRNIRNECERHMAKHSRSNYWMSCTGHPWDINSVVSMQSPLLVIWLLLWVLKAR